MADEINTGLVVDQIEGHSLVHLRVAGGDCTALRANDKP
jgi:hypothetical protein